MIYLIGDSILDQWVIGDVHRISPESPVPILNKKKINNTLGGASYVFRNLQNLDINCFFISTAASDFNGNLLKKKLDEKKTKHLNYSLLKSRKITTTKIRYLSSNKQLLRVDEEELLSDNNKLIDKAIKKIKKNSCVFLSDYGKGDINQKLINKIKKITKYIYVDPKQKAEIYKGCYLIKPNMNEFENWFGKFSVSKAKKKLEEYKWQYLVVTDGGDGSHLISKTSHHHFKNEHLRLTDVTGAGDVYFSIIAYGIFNNKNIIDSCRLASVVSSKSVSKLGTVPITPSDLNTKVIFTNGVFDILHYGHLSLLEYAKSLGQKLIVGINSDESVKMNKGDGRPYNSASVRKAQLEILPWVDEVIIFNNKTPYDLIEKLKPDIIVKGSDYNAKNVVGQNLAEIKIFKIKKGFSSTKYINQIK